MTGSAAAFDAVLTGFSLKVTFCTGPGPLSKSCAGSAESVDTGTRFERAFFDERVRPADIVWTEV